MQTAKKKDGGTWIVDHTNQIGKEKVLTVLRVRGSPRAGVALRHEDVEVLAATPGTEWKREDVGKAYLQLEQRYGTPDSVVTDGAVELREPVEGLDHPQSTSRAEVSIERMEEKLGWLRDFATSISQWQDCQEVISKSLTFLNQQGINAGVVEEYRKDIAGIAKSPASQQLVSNTEALLSEYEKKLKPNERLRISTEILESSFSLYKQLEQQHSKSGFTSLLLAFPTLLRPTTAKEVTTCFAQVKVSDVKAWAKEHLPNTLASKRQRMFREANPKPKGKTKTRATSLSNAV